MKPPAKHEIPANIWKFLNNRVPESIRGIAAVELMAIISHHQTEKVRIAATEAAKRMHNRMSYRFWMTFLYGVIAGLSFATIVLKIVQWTQ